MKHASLPQRAGLTLVELLMVIVILAVLAVIAAPSFGDLLDRQRVWAAAAELSTDIAYARSQAGLRRSNLAIDFNRNAQMSCYTIAAKTVLGSCDCRLGQGQACPLVIAGMDTTTELKTRQVPTDTGVSFGVSTSSNGWPGGVVNSMRFSAPQMTLAPADARILIQGRKARLEVRVNVMGHVQTCVPAGSDFSGFLPCSPS